MAVTINASTSAGAVTTADTSGVLQLQTGGTTALTVDASQNVGIGTSSPSQKLEVAGNALLSNNQYLGIKDSTGAAVGFPIYTGSNDAIFGYLASGSTGISTYQFRTGNNTERMRIDSSGNLLVGTTSVGGVGHTFLTTGNYLSAMSGTGNNVHHEFKNGNGTVGYILTNGTSTSYVTSSDYRLKEAITPMTGALARVAALKPVTYKWKLDGSDGQGFIAHELAEVEAGCVTGEKDAVDAEGNPQYQGIDTSFLVATLTAAIQEQQTLITQLQADVALLKGAQL